MVPPLGALPRPLVGAIPPQSALAGVEPSLGALPWPLVDAVPPQSALAGVSRRLACAAIGCCGIAGRAGGFGAAASPAAYGRVVV